MPVSSPTSLVNAAAASTHRIGLGTTVTVLSTDEPIRVFQQLGTAAAIAPGRIEAVAGRGSSDTTFPLFDLDAGDYDMRGMPQATFLKGIELLGTEVLPQIKKELGRVMPTISN